LNDVPFGSEANRVHHVLWVLGRGDHHNGGARRQVDHAAQPRESLPAGHRQVQHDQIDAVLLAGQSQRLVEIRGLDDLHLVSEPLQEVAKPLPEQGVVIC
jgi:hypothetical protein